MSANANDIFRLMIISDAIGLLESTDAIEDSPGIPGTTLTVTQFG
ncbi:MAG: hypothetical protein ACO3YX_06125 [Candidatus Nanopelagicaceae bacterium]